MLSKTSTVQNIKTSELLFEEAVVENTQNIFSNYLEKITSQNIGQVKIYLGLAYFVLVSVLSFSLFF